MAEISEKDKKLVSDLEKSVSKESKSLRHTIFRKGAFERILGLISPMASSSPWFGVPMGILRPFQHIFNVVQEQNEWQARISIDQKISARLTEEFVTTMPEVERNVKTEGFLRGKITTCARSMANLVSARAQRKVCFMGALLSVGLGFGKGSLVNGLIAAGIVGIPVVGAQLMSGVLRLVRERGSDKHVQKMWTPIWQKTSSLLSDPALSKATGTTQEGVAELNEMIENQNEVKSIWNKEILRVGVVPVVTADIASLLAMGTSYLVAGDWVNAIAAYAASNGLASSIAGMFSANMSIKRLVTDIANRYNEAKHDKTYDLQYGQEKMPENTDTICLDHVVYKFRNVDSKNKKDWGTKTAGTAFKSDETIFVEPGITILGGMSGAGKTTFYSLLRHADDVDEGSIAFGHKEGDKFVGSKISDFDLDEAPRQIGFSLQSVSVHDDRTVFDVIRMQNPNLTDEEIERFAKILDLDLYNVSDSGEKTPKKYRGNNTSGGEKKRILFLQALLSGKRFLVFDEPTSGVNEGTRDKMIQLLNAVAKTKKVTVLYTTHNSDEIGLLEARGAVDLVSQPSGDKSKREPSIIMGYSFKDLEEKTAYMEMVKHRHGTTPAVETEDKKEAIDWEHVGEDLLSVAEAAHHRKKAPTKKENPFLEQKRAITVDVMTSTLKNNRRIHSFLKKQHDMVEAVSQIAKARKAKKVLAKGEAISKDPEVKIFVDDGLEK